MVWLVDRARDLARNNPYATKALSELVVPRSGRYHSARQHGDDKLNVLIDQKFERWATDCDADGQFDFFGSMQVARPWRSASVSFDSAATPGMESTSRSSSRCWSLITSTTTKRCLSHRHDHRGVQFDKIDARRVWMFGITPAA